MHLWKFDSLLLTTAYPTTTNLFNPFFNTKAAGQGIGLTLSRDILLNHGFTFSLLTEAIAGPHLPSI